MSERRTGARRGILPRGERGSLARALLLGGAALALFGACLGGVLVARGPLGEPQHAEDTPSPLGPESAHPNVSGAIELPLAQAGFGGRRLLFRGPRSATRSPPPQEQERRPRPSADIELTMAQARPMVKRYYEGYGPWAGQYVMDEVARMRFVQHGRDRVHAHVRYRYRCVLPACGGTLNVGYDQRVFYFERRGGRWQVIWMGGHMSGQMD
jgi:hypothetical protein